MKISRRNLVVKSVGAIGVLAAGGEVLAAGAEALVCGLTPAQTEGPFYPIDDQLDKDNDLTKVQGNNVGPMGEKIYIRGTVTDEACKPVDGALVEIWQACASGKYNHKGDPNPAPLDPNFQYWGQALTDANGAYIFKTIIPGAYPADTDWMRPSHIHYKVHKRGFKELTTQLYFKGHKYNDTDLILQALPKAEQEKVIVELKAPEQGFDPNARIATFDISIRRVRANN